MEQIPLLAEANQSVDVLLGSTPVTLLVQETNGAMVITVTVDGTDLVSAVRCIPYQAVIPYDYIGLGMGNFAWDTGGDDLPYWDQFGITHFLIWASQDELDAAGA